MNKKLSLWFLVNVLSFVGCTTASHDSPPLQAVSLEDKQPVVVVRFYPVYPIELKKAEVSGGAEVEFVVDTEGNVVNVRVVSATREEFGIASVVCIKNWKYTPGIHNGHLARARMRQSFNFDIKQAEGG